MKISPVETEIFHADGRTYAQTDMTRPTVAPRNFTNAPNKKVGEGTNIHKMADDKYKLCPTATET